MCITENEVREVNVNEVERRNSSILDRGWEVRK